MKFETNKKMQLQDLLSIFTSKNKTFNFFGQGSDYNLIPT